MTISWVHASALSLLAIASACRKDESGGGLPPADDWEAPDETKAATKVEAPAPREAEPSGAAADPHAGMAMGSNPHAGMGMGGDPGAGMGMGGDPHAGMGAGSGADHGVPGVDPSSPIDASMFLAGTIVVSDELARRIKPGSVVFLSVHRFDERAEGPVGSALATEKLESATFPAEFRITGRNAMGGGGFAGDVVISAWTDQDRDAISKQPGDVLGRVRATIPSDGLELKLDTVLE